MAIRLDVTESSGGDGWWKAPDNLWYPPEAHPDYVPPAPVAGASYHDREQDSGVVRTRSADPPAASPPTPPLVVSIEPPSSRLVLWSAIALLLVSAVTLAGVGLISLSSGDDAAPELSAADVTIEATGALAPAEALVTTGVEAFDGVVVFGTTDDASATAGEVWGASVLSSGPSAAVVVGNIEVPRGVAYLYGVASRTGGFLAAGEIFFPDSGESQPALFASTSGIDWSLLASPDLLNDTSAVLDVAVVGDLAVAVAPDDQTGENRLYRSDDGGIGWDPIDASGFDGGVVWGLGSHDGSFYAVGETFDTDGAAIPTVHTSTDGVTWTGQRFVLDGSAVGGRLFDLTAVEGGLVAVGSQPDTAGTDLLVLFSPTGAIWERVVVPRSGQASEVLFSVFRTADGAVATGQIDERYAFWQINLGE